MTQDQMWKAHYAEYAAFVRANGRCPSKHYAEERNLHSWWKHTRKQLNAGTLKAERLEPFRELMALAERHRHLNQYV